MKNITRRSFIRTGSAAAAALTIVPNTVLGKSHGHTTPTDKLNIAGIGIGGRGSGVLRTLETEILLLFVTWIGNIQNPYLINILKLKNIGTIVKCMMKWAVPLMRSW